MLRRHLILFFLLAMTLTGRYAEAQQQPLNPGLEMMLFYKHPTSELAALILDAIGNDPRSNLDSAQGAIVGFATIVFKKYPDQIDRFLPEQPSAQLMASIATALRLAGHSDRAAKFVTPITGDARAKDFLNRLPKSLDAIQATGAYEFDLFWGATFASGDAAYCSKILDRYVKVANVGDNAEHVLILARGQQSPAQIQDLVAQIGQEKSIELIHVASALASLKSNARAHAFIGEMLAKHIKANPDTPATKAILEL